MSKKNLHMEEIHAIEREMLKATIDICQKNNIKYSMICGSVLGAVRHGGPIPWDPDVDITIPYEVMDKFFAVLEEQLPDWCCLYNYKNMVDYHRYLPRIGLKGYRCGILHIDIFPQVGLPDDPEKQRKYSNKTKWLNRLYFYKSISKGERIYPSGNRLKDLVKRIAKIGLKLTLWPISREKIIKMMDAHFSKYPYSKSKYVMNPLGHYGLKNVLDRNYFEDLIEVDYDGIKVCIPRDYESYLTHYYKDYKKFPPKEEQERLMAYTVEVNEDFDINKLVNG